MNDFIILQLKVVDFFNPDEPLVLDYLFIFISLFGDWKVLAALTALAFLRDRKLGKRLALLFLIALALLLPLKALIHEERPPVVGGEIRPVGGLGETSSFPSGHATLAFAYASMLASIYGRKRYFYSYALLVAFSRLYLGQHYPSDLVFGAALGLFSARLTNFIYLKKEVSPWKP
jgi:undecaprenyl-diphosphatase